MTEIDKGTIEPTKNEHAITEVPTNSNFKHITLDEENDSEVDNFADAYGSQVDVEENDPYDYNDYTSNYESDYEESEQKEIDLTQEKKVDNNTNISSEVQGQTLISCVSSNDDVSSVDEKPEISSNVESRTEISTGENEVENTTASITYHDQGQNSISNTSSSGEVSNEKKTDEKTDIVISPITAQSRRENASRTSSTDSFQTDVSEKENFNVSDHESDTSYEKDELENGEKIFRSIDQDKISTDSGKEKLDIVTTEVESSLEEVLPSTLDKSEDDSGEDKLGKSLDKNVNNLIEKTSNSSSEETEDKSGENNKTEEKSDKLNKKLVENSPTEIISETIVDDKVILESSAEFENKKSDNINFNGKNLQNIPDHKPGILPINTSFSSFSSEYNQSVRDSMTESFTSKPSSFSSISMYQSVDLTNGREDKNTILEKNALNRISVASLRENPELNDISLDDESSNVHDSPKEWHLSDWGFPKTPTSLKSISTFFSPRSTTSTVTSTSSKSSSSSDSRRMSTVSMTSTGSNYDLLLARLERENQLLQEDPKAKRMSLQGIAELKASFERVQHEAQIDDDIDWDFWGQIISDYETVARTQPRQLSKMIQKGIPQALRGMIWQLMSKSKDSELESTYAQLLKETSTHEKMIMRDLNRTFPKHEFFKDQDGLGQEGLFNVVKAYSLYDTEVGYCQGISFVVGPLLLNMPDEEAFCVLVKLMTFYNMRSHFLPGMDGLQLRLYQFDRLVEEMLPKVHNHLQAQGINSSMIYDTIFTEGIEAIFRFSIALLKKNEKRIVEMEFETLLEYLKSGLFENYQINHTGVLAQLVKETQYHTNDFVKDAYDIRITPKKLNKYQQAYYAHQEAEKRKLLAEAEAIEKLRSNNIQLSSRVKQLEGSLQTLNREHVELANELINTRMELAKSNDENKELHSTVEELHKIVELQPAEIEAKLREEMNILAKKNISLVQKNNLLEDQLANLENMLIESKMRYAESENEREVLQRKWNDLKKALG
ncbi:hypothetical protein RhiirA1_390172 [Rhizophagus irregularis]|uniref:Uncharacterized protein n=2 Tax=Rhizophagus irregularis TaxID=588596 RepID=A0A2I1E004_9GLOM|nr:hypothetical protein GLOIN_2v1484582 [Rhizophagus irregularis DAOM 181602=DAOM 197198]PKC71930.1 hypothetical protein RhiirA1_390172 [Rhizophagus irregularis]PKY15461.1 hypothetical protein RhiirB3_513582 [Rhizophagus irregularis]POG63524.1 hypothetical protein GLOIN_2v1484582 [Rhizophagus irregularis DAOM 181602=DAOM 197198]|eukprot:XP_025170390.1 hypothetical protein GLOIN_2v1484582 [Rhizophagus irregularis DAOM 181602=DAOM 197198]